MARRYISILIVALLLASTAAYVVPSAANASIAFVWRVFLEESTESWVIPMFVQVFNNDKYAVVTGVEGTNTTVYVVDLETTSVVMKHVVEKAVPLCVSSSGDSLSIVLDKGGGRVQEIVITPDLHVLNGMSHKIDMPVFLAGCAMAGPNYIIYGSAVVRGKSLEAFIDIVNPGGQSIAVETWGGEGDQLLKQVVGNLPQYYLIVSNLSGNTIDIYNMTINMSTPTISKWMSLQHVKVIDAYRISQTLVILGLDQENRSVIDIVEHGDTTTIKLSPNAKAASIVGYARGNLLVAGLIFNATTHLNDGLLLLFNYSDKKVIATDIAYGKQDVSYTTGKMLGQDLALVAGLHGGIPVLVLYQLSFSAEPGGQQSPEGPPASTGPNLKLLIPIIIVLLIIISIVFIAKLRRTKPSARHSS